jgi:signal transduction histidine kinase
MPRLSLRTRFFLYSNTLIVVTMTVVAILAIAHERRVRYEAIERRGRSICEAMTIPITDALMYEDLGLSLQRGLIDDFISEIQKLNQDLMRYVVVTDPAGRVTHSNDWRLLGGTFDRALDAASGIRAPVSEIREGTGDEQVLEVRSPLNIATNFWGSLVVGFSLHGVEEQVRQVAARVVQAAVLLLVGNSALTAVYVETLIRPILDLHQKMKRAAHGDLTARAHPRSSTTEVRELGEQFNRMMDDLEEANEREKVRQAQLAHTEKMAAVGTLAAGVAHEVNNPLGGILTCIENLRANPDDRDMRQRYLGLIQDGLERIEQTVANLLDFSRQGTMEPAPTSINRTLDYVIELVQYQLRASGIDVRWNLDPKDPYVMGDHFRMEQLFLNLVLNALQAMPDGGDLTLSTGHKAGSVVVEVRDTGVGIPDSVRERIFDPFFTTREVGKGTGLGLTVSDTIVTSHNGTLEVESVVGSGSTFRATFPLLSLGAAGGNAP